MIVLYIYIFFLEEGGFRSTRLKRVLGQYWFLTDRNTRDMLAWPIANGDPMHEVYPTQDTSLMATTRVKQEQEADTRIIARE